MCLDVGVLHFSSLSFTVDNLIIFLDGNMFALACIILSSLMNFITHWLTVFLHDNGYFLLIVCRLLVVLNVFKLSRLCGDHPLRVTHLTPLMLMLMLMLIMLLLLLLLLLLILLL
jgi:hypothetical protein